mmetsp:Transcript_9751/g.29052  ORF Transcript_9751/g.29052 Transcript_9751/m.29052 type:complete len:376 (+) Transcript_9751:1784-2911(+)
MRRRVQSHQLLEEGFRQFVIRKQGISVNAVQFAVGRCRCTPVEFELSARSRVETEQFVQPSLDSVSARVSDRHVELDLAERSRKDFAANPSSRRSFGRCFVALLVHFCFPLFGSGTDNLPGRGIGNVQLCESSTLGFSQFLDELQTQSPSRSFVSVDCGTEKGQPILVLHEFADDWERNGRCFVDGDNLCRREFVGFAGRDVLDDLAVTSVNVDCHDAFDGFAPGCGVVRNVVIQMLLVLECLEAAAQKVKDRYEILWFRSCHGKRRVSQGDSTRQTQSHRRGLSTTSGGCHCHGRCGLGLFRASFQKHQECLCLIDRLRQIYQDANVGSVDQRFLELSEFDLIRCFLLDNLSGISFFHSATAIGAGIQSLQGSP